MPPVAPCVLGIDLGTSSAKAVLIDTRGGFVAQANAAYPVRAPHTGWAESDPDEWWAAVVGCVRAVIADAGRAPVAVGLSGQMHGLVVTDGDATPLRPALLWADSRARDQLAAYRSLPSDALARLANPLVAGMAGPLLRWLAEHEPQTYRRTEWALQPKDWLRHRLTGSVASEPSDASATLLYDVPGDRWDEPVLRALGLGPELLAPLLPDSAESAGGLTHEAAQALGIAAGTPVAAGAGDTAAAALGSGLCGAGDVALTVGTGAQVLRPTAEPLARAEAGVHLYRSAGGPRWYQMGATLSAGLSLDWVRRTMAASWDELYTSLDAPARGDDPIFVPHLSGERTPYLDAQLRGSWTGLSLRHDRPVLLRSALEGVAFSICEAFDALVGDGRPQRVRLAGGGTIAPAWRQLLADTLDVALDAVDVPAASGRGAALLGALAAGLVDAADVFGPLAPPVHPVAEPTDARGENAERLQRFRDITCRLRDLDGP